MTFVQIIDRWLWNYAKLTGLVLLGKSDPPPAPDYAAAAKEQGTANLEAARASSKLSNPNWNNPLGSRRVTYGINGDPDQVFVEDSLTPLGQQRFDQEQRINTQLGSVAEEGIGRVKGMLGTQFDMSQVQGRPDLQNALSRDKVTQSIVDRNQPMMERRRQQLETQLSNQGIYRGSEAWNAAMDDISREENDFRLGAIQAGGAEQSRMYGLESDSREKDIQTQAYLRSLPLNEINALRTGSQVMMPQFQAHQGQNVQAPDLLGATNMGYNAKLGNVNAQNANAAQTGQAVAGIASAAAMMF